MVDREGLVALPLPAGHYSWLREPSLEEECLLADLRLLPAVIPGKIAAIGRNYAAHAKEL